MKYRFYVSSLFILLQIGLIFYARFTPLRFFCWAPYDIHTKFKATATINNKTLDSKDLAKRYKYFMEGWEQRSVYNIFSIIEQYENTYSQNDKVEVNVKYSINGHSEETWTYKN